MVKILIIDDDTMMCDSLAKLIYRLGHECRYAHTIREGQKLIAAELFDIVLLDVQLPDGTGLDLIPAIRKGHAAAEVIIITSAGDADGAELAIKNGAWNYMEKPFSNHEITREINHVISYRAAKPTAEKPVVFNRAQIIGNSYQLNRCMQLLVKASSGSANVLIEGETGTGKELAAKAIHENSSRRNNNFIVVDCAAIPGTLIESILFGCKKGAFTGADNDMEGLVKQADGGTLFLDEVGELPFEFQKTFLRVLQERSFRPLGAKVEELSNFRIISATNRNLADMVEKGMFRRDLLFRLETMNINIPPLRERVEDIKELVKHYVASFCELSNVGIKGISQDFIDYVSAYSWSGNVRELVNAVEWSITTAQNNSELIPMHLPENIRIQVARSSFRKYNVEKEKPEQTPFLSENLPVLNEVRKKALADLEKQYLNALILKVNGDVKKACKMSGLARAQLYNLLKKHDLILRKK